MNNILLKQIGMAVSLSVITGLATAKTHQITTGSDDKRTISWSTTAGISLKSIDFSESISPALGSASGQGGISINVPTLGLSITATYDKYFAAFGLESSIADVADTSAIPYASGEAHVYRQDYSFLIGYRAFEKVSVFGGYLTGETTVEPIAGTGGTYQSPTTNATLNNNIAAANPGYEQVYSESGIFVGAGYGFAIGSNNYLSIKGSFAHLSSQYEDDAATGAFSFEGDADGFSFGIAWLGHLNDHITYKIGFKRQNYTTNNAEDSNFNNKVEFEETISSLGAGLEIAL